MIYNFVFNSIKGSGATQQKTFSNVNFGNMEEGEYKGTFSFHSKVLTIPTTLAKCFLPMIYLDVGQSKVQETTILNSYTSTGQTINITNTLNTSYTLTATTASNNSLTITGGADDLFIGRQIYIAGAIGNITAGFYTIVSKLNQTDYTISTTAGVFVNQTDATGSVILSINTMTLDNTNGLYRGQTVSITGTTQNGVVLGATTIDEVLSPTTISISSIDNTLISGATTTLQIAGVNVINNYGFQLSKFIGLAFWNEVGQRQIKAYQNFNPPFSLDVKPTYNQITISVLDETGASWGDNVGILTDWILVLSLEKVSK
jgi:hypothetical protein